MSTSKTRCLGLEVGDCRIGIAISDLVGATAAGLETIERKSLSADIAVIADIARRHNASEIIVGLPTNNNSDDDHLMRTVAFGKKLAQATGLPVIYEDERMGTVSAIRTLTLQGVKSARKQKHDVEDMQQAAVILQRHLDRKSPPPSA